MKWKYLIGWLPMVLIAILNGTFREIVYKPSLGDLRAHQLSTVIGIILLGVYIWFLIRRWRLQSSLETLRIGFVWLLLTVAFEFGFGHFVMGRPWDTLLHDYKLSDGRIWTAVLIWVTIAPTLFYRIQKRIERGSLSNDWG